MLPRNLTQKQVPSDHYLSAIVRKSLGPATHAWARGPNMSEYPYLMPEHRYFKFENQYFKDGNPYIGPYVPLVIDRMVYNMTRCISLCAWDPGESPLPYMAKRGSKTLSRNLTQKQVGEFKSKYPKRVECYNAESESSRSRCLFPVVIY